ncbi:uncharacterized protein LOC134853499 [Symsagittifera roscoffensis]|uniref:uncharacterized protein LOC134853499 n=1 Tax=Symsagittifera roscoffensis TaxID=84072 RepID=UPI00307B80F3
MQAVTEETHEPEPVTAADDFKVDYRAAARNALNRVQEELVTKEIEQKVTPQVMWMLGGLLEREVTRDDPEWRAAVASLTVREKIKIMPSRRQHEENERDSDDLETIAVSKRSISLLPQKEVIRTELQPFKQETQLLAKIRCVKMEEDTHQPNELNSQMRVMKTSHDQMGHQGIDKVYQRIVNRFEWPGMKKACEKWVTACLSCQQVKDPKKLRFPLQSIESSKFNEVLQIDHQNICMTDTGYIQVLVMIDHFTKYAEAVPCITASAEETCDHLINTWIARHGCPMTFHSDN